MSQINDDIYSRLRRGILPSQEELILNKSTNKLLRALVYNGDLFNLETVLNNRTYSLDEALRESILVCNSKLIAYFMDRVSTENYTLNWMVVLGAAVEANNRELITLAISKLKNINYNNLLFFACKGNHKDLIDLFSKKITEQGKKVELFYCLTGACEGGHNDLINFYVTKFPPNYRYLLMARYLVLGGHKDLARFYLDKGIENNTGDFFSRDLSPLMEYTAQAGFKDLTEFLIEKMITTGIPIELNYAMSGAARGGHIELIEFLHRKMSEPVDWEWCLSSASEEGDMETVYFFIEKVENQGIKPCWELHMIEAAQNGHIELIKFYISKQKDQVHIPENSKKISWDPNGAIQQLISHGYTSSIKLVTERYIEKGRILNWDRHIQKARENSLDELVYFFKNKQELLSL